MDDPSDDGFEEFFNSDEFKFDEDELDRLEIPANAEVDPRPESELISLLTQDEATAMPPSSVGRALATAPPSSVGKAAPPEIDLVDLSGDLDDLDDLNDLDNLDGVDVRDLSELPPSSPKSLEQNSGLLANFRTLTAPKLKVTQKPLPRKRPGSDGVITQFFSGSSQATQQSVPGSDVSVGDRLAGSSQLGQLPQHLPNFDLSSVGVPDEPPTHHELQMDNLATFNYPVNRQLRDYQRNIVRKALTRNIVCALPTGLGKTFIASVVMWNWYRWTKTAKIIFVAPTRPLVTQQVESFLDITGISVKDTTVFVSLTVSKQDRESAWRNKRVFFATPQIVDNDLAAGLLDPRSVVCVVIDEAHRATGNYSYVNLVQQLRTAQDSFRVLALTATPASTYEGVQEVLDNLMISDIEIRSEDSLDVRQYSHNKNVNKVVTPLNKEQKELMRLATLAVKDLVKPLHDAKIVYTTDAGSISAFQLLDSLQKFMRSQRGSNTGFMWKLKSIGMTLHPVVYALGLLKSHGVYPFYMRIRELQTNSGKHAKELVKSQPFVNLMRYAETLIFSTLTPRVRNDQFFGHPKLEHLVGILHDFFISHGAESRAIIFAEFRESVAEILWVLEKHCPGLVNSEMFVGQASSKDGGKGMTQKEQQGLLRRFKNGEPNVLVATSVAEEGLDIGEVDLIVCYDQSRSPVRIMQRMGRTGRQREGQVYMLMTEKEKEKLEHGMGGYKWLQKMIIGSKTSGPGRSLTYHESARIIPRGINPKYEEVTVETPQENIEALQSGDLIKVLTAKPRKRARKDPRQSELPFKKTKAKRSSTDSASERPSFRPAKELITDEQFAEMLHSSD